MDFQDCAGAAGQQAVCTGITEYPTATGGRLDLGSIAVMDPRASTVGHQRRSWLPADGTAMVEQSMSSGGSF